jgi:methylated-DNA-[protein]-cysteine S-methyltransferase
VNEVTSRDVAFTVHPSPIGDLLLAATDQGLALVGFRESGASGETRADAALERLAREVGQRVVRAPERLGAVARQFDEYFAGTRQVFDLPLDLRLAHGFRRVVLDHLLAIGYGRTAGYADVAAAAGNPRAVRAVGSACAHNPVPVVVPCHRVLRSDGSLGGYAGGLEVKRFLLTLEAGPGRTRG